MNAVLKQKSVAALQAEVSGLERSLAESQRARDAARSSRPRLLVEGDEEALAKNAQAIKLAERDVTNHSATLESMREALRLAQERDRAEARRASYAAIRQQSKATREAVVKLDEALIAFAQAYPAARAAIEKLDSVLVNNGVDAADPLLLKARLRGVAEQALWLHSDGIFGKPNGLASRDELRASGGASVRRAVSEFCEVVLRRARGRLGVEE